MPRALVTGSNGHIGANLVRDLLAHDWEVVALVRSGSDLTGLQGVPVTTVIGDALDGDGVAAAARGCDVVFHAGTPYRTWARDDTEVLRPAVEGTEAVIRAARRAGARRVVYTSSCNAVGFTRDPAHLPDERQWNEAPRSVYIRAKLLAERKAWEVAREVGIELVAVLPTTVLGRFDYRVTPTSAPLFDVIRGRSPVPFATNLVDVRDVARAHVLAAERGEPGERYLAGGDNVSAEEIAGLVEKLVGRRPKVGLPPRAVLGAAAWVAELVARLGGPPPFMTRALLADVHGRSVVFDCARARERLGLAPRGAEAVLAETVRWGVFLGRLDGALAAKFPPEAGWVKPAAKNG